MRHVKNLKRARQLLESALTCIDTNINDLGARRNIKTAIGHLDKLLQQKSNKKELNDQHELWWSRLQSGVAHGSMTKEGYAKCLNQLNQVIDQEKAKLAELEKQASEVETEETFSEGFN